MRNPVWKSFLFPAALVLALVVSLFAAQSALSFGSTEDGYSYQWEQTPPSRAISDVCASGVCLEWCEVRHGNPVGGTGTFCCSEDLGNKAQFDSCSTYR